MLYFFDASAIVKLLFEESEEKGAIKVKKLCDSPCVARTTWLCVAEAYGCLKRLWMKKKLSQRQYDRKLFHMQEYVQNRIKLDNTWIKLPLGEFHKIRVLLKTYPHIDFSDALHIVVLKRRQPLNPVFVTSDKNLITAARSENVEVWNPESNDPYPQ